MADSTSGQVKSPLNAAGPQSSPMTEQKVDISLRTSTGNPTASQFWPAYERLAKQQDDEFLERQNKHMDGLLLFAGIFAAVSSAFIVNLESRLSPDPSDTTNALLMILINKIDNGTFPEQEASLPVWTGLSATEIWIQTLAYTSLSISLLASLGAVIVKQWLEYFRTSRFGRGSLDERCKRRQRKLDGLETWHVDAIIAILPSFLQLSLLFFGIALSADIWTQQHTIASVIVGTTALGVLFYAFTAVATVISPDCPFQTPMSIVLGHLRHAIAPIARKESRRYFLNSLYSSFSGMFINWRQTITSSVLHFFKTVSQIKQKVRLPLPLDDPESAVEPEERELAEQWDLKMLESPAQEIGARSVQWILDTSTDTDTITSAVRMVPEIEWPDNYDVTGVLYRLKSHFYSCFDSARQLPRHLTARAVACLKAIHHLEDRSLEIEAKGIYSKDYHCVYQMPRNLPFDIVSCAAGDYISTISLSSSDRMWLAHMFTFGLHKEVYPEEFDGFVIDFISDCLRDMTSPRRLVADCLLLTGQLIGLQIDRRHLQRLDKSSAIPSLRKFVIKRLLDVLLDPDSNERYALNARKLVPTSSESLGRQIHFDDNTSIRCLKLGLHFLEEEAGIFRDPAQFKNVATMLRLSLIYSLRVPWYFLHQDGIGPEWGYWFKPDWHTSEQFDLLIDYLVWVCEGTDYEIIGDAFWVLAGLRGSPSTLTRKRTFIETASRFMKTETTSNVRYAALHAVCVIQSDVALIGRNDKSFRDLFSQTLASAVMDGIKQQPSNQGDNNPFVDDSFLNLGRVPHYLSLLCTLVREPSWHEQLQRDGHFNNCLVLANALPSVDTDDNDWYGKHAVHLAHIFALVDSLGQEHQFFKADQMPHIWPLVMRAWRHIFNFAFFVEVNKANWGYITSTGYIEALPSLITYAKKHGQQWDNKETGTLVELVGEVRDKLDNEMCRSEQGKHGQDASFGHQGIPALGKQIRKLLAP